MAKEICPVCRGKKIVKCEDYGMTYGTYDHSNVTIQGSCPAFVVVLAKYHVQNVMVRER